MSLKIRYGEKGHPRSSHFVVATLSGLRMDEP